MRLASVCLGPLQKAALFAVETKEKKMRAYSLTELFCMTRNQLFALHAETVAELSDPTETSPDRAVALDTLRHIRRVLARMAPGP